MEMILCVNLYIASAAILHFKDAFLVGVVVELGSRASALKTMVKVVLTRLFLYSSFKADKC